MTAFTAVAAAPVAARARSGLGPSARRSVRRGRAANAVVLPRGNNALVLAGGANGLVVLTSTPSGRPGMNSFHIKQGDTSPALEAVLHDVDGAPVNLTDASVRFHLATNTLKPVATRSATIVDGAKGKVRYSWQAEDTRTRGVFLGEWQVTYADGSVETFPNDGYLYINIRQGIDE